MVKKSWQDHVSALEKWFATKEKVAVAFSGGVDSALLFFLGSRVLGPDCRGLFANSPLMSSHQLAAARDFSERYSLSLEVKSHSPFNLKGFSENNSDRCYICKKALYEDFIASLPPGWHLADGTNLDDSPDQRPGFQAIRELGVCTPFLGCGLGKREIREVSRFLGLPTWDRPSDSCLATRLLRHSVITEQDLHKVAEAEAVLRQLGFEGVRANLRDDLILLTFQEGDLGRAVGAEMRENIQKKLQEHSFSKVFLDLSERPGILP